MSTNAFSVSSPRRDPHRGLLLFLATYLESWDAVLAIQQAVFSECDGETPTEHDYISVAVPLITEHLQQAAQHAIQSQDTLTHVVVQHASQELRSLDNYNNTCADKVLQKITRIDDQLKKIIECYYRDHYEFAGLAGELGINEKEIPGHLCHVRSVVDWYSDGDEWAVNPNELLIPTLISEYVLNKIDPDSLALLTSSLTRNLDSLSRFERQVRLHLLLTAMYVELSPTKKSSTRMPAVNRQNVETSRISSGRTPVRHTYTQAQISTLATHKEKKGSPAPLLMILGTIGIGIVLGVVLLNTSTAAPSAGSKSTTESVSQIATVSGTVSLARGSENLTPRRGDHVYDGDSFETQTTSSLIIETTNNVRLELGEEGKIASYKIVDKVCNILLDRGSLVVTDRRGMSSDGVKVVTPQGIVQLQGAQANVSIKYGRTEVQVEKGQALFAKSNGTGEVTILPGRRGRSRQGDTPVVVQKPIFMRGINLGGNEKNIDGKLWLSQRKAMHAGFVTSVTQFVKNDAYKTDTSDIGAICHTGINAKEGVVFSQIAPNGDIEMTLWASSKSELMPVPLIVGDEKITVNPVHLGNNIYRLGPVPASVKEKKITLSLQAPLVVSGLQLDGLNATGALMPQPVYIRGDPYKIYTYVGKEMYIESMLEGDSTHIERIDYVIGGDVVGAQRIAPYNINWTPDRSGSVQIILRTTDKTGGVYESLPVQLDIGNSYGSGHVTREVWRDKQDDPLDYEQVSNLLRKMPHLKTTVNSIATARHGDNYIQRLSGYIVPPISGGYKFMIAGDDNCEMWLQNEDGEKVRIAYLDNQASGVKVYDWGHQKSQVSSIIELQQTKWYYFEVWLKETDGDDHVEVAWQLPNGHYEIPIPGYHCIPNPEYLMPVEKKIALPPIPHSTDVTVVQAINLGGSSTTINDVKWIGQVELEKKAKTESETVWLSDLQWKYAKNGYGPLILDKSNGDMQGLGSNKLRIGNEAFKKGIGTHAPAELIYPLGGQFEKFQAMVGVNALVNKTGSITIEVYVDDKLAFNSGNMGANDKGKDIDIDVRGARELKLIVTDSGSFNLSDVADWGDARLTRPAADLILRAGTVGSKPIMPKPAVDMGTRTMLSRGIVADDNGIDIGVRIANGAYYLYVWTIETNANDPMSFELLIEGRKTALNMKSLKEGEWQRLGPFPVAVNDGEMRLRVPPKFKNAQLMGIEIIKDNIKIETKEDKAKNSKFAISVHEAKSGGIIEGLESLQDGDTIILSALPSKVINFSFAAPNEVNNLRFYLPKCSLQETGDEFYRPFTLGNNGPNMKQWQPVPGDYHLKVEYFTDNKRDKVFHTTEIRFTIRE